MGGVCVNKRDEDEETKCYFPISSEGIMIV